MCSISCLRNKTPLESFMAKIFFGNIAETISLASKNVFSSLRLGMYKKYVSLNFYISRRNKSMSDTWIVSLVTDCTRVQCSVQLHNVEKAHLFLWLR